MLVQSVVREVGSKGGLAATRVEADPLKYQPLTCFTSVNFTLIRRTESLLIRVNSC